MSHLWLERPEVRVTVESNGQPCVVCWGSRAHQVVSIVEHWRENRRWWSTHRDRDLWQLLTDSALFLELIYDRQQRVWLLQRIYD